MRILFLDDAQIRHDLFARAHGGDEVVHVFTAAAATRALDEGSPFHLAHLDYDLADEFARELTGGELEVAPAGAPPFDPGTGMDVVRHIVEMPPERRPSRVVVHSHNPIAKEMVARLEAAGVPASWVKF